MRSNLAVSLALLAVLSMTEPVVRAQEFPSFRMQEIDTGLGVGYAVLLVDVNNDGKKDIVVVDTDKVVWYENPSWKKRIIIQGGTKKDNVCIAPFDIDGDGQIDFALGADWKPFNTASGGTLQWLKRGKTLDEPWTIHPIATEPTIHRIRFCQIDASGKPALVSVPLMGRGSSIGKNWMDGVPVRITAYRIPNDPIKDRWMPEVLDESLHVCHNFWPLPAPAAQPQNILVASYEGVSLLSKGSGSWRRKLIGAGNQDNLKGSRGASEVKQGSLKNGRKVIATIEPWHGNQVVVYTEPGQADRLWDRHLIDAELKWGHGVSFADLDGDGSDELIIGVRDDAGKDTPRRGIRIYRATDDKGSQWTRQIIDNGGMACEDLAAADLNGDGRVDIVAVGRATHNVRIYWNEGKK